MTTLGDLKRKSGAASRLVGNFRPRGIAPVQYVMTSLYLDIYFCVHLFPILLPLQHVLPPNGQSRDLDVALTYLSAVSDPGEGVGGGVRADIVAVAVVVLHAWLLVAIDGKVSCAARVFCAAFPCGVAACVSTPRVPSRGGPWRLASGSEGRMERLLFRGRTTVLRYQARQPWGGGGHLLWDSLCCAWVSLQGCLLCVGIRLLERVNKGVCT